MKIEIELKNAGREITVSLDGKQCSGWHRGCSTEIDPTELPEGSPGREIIGNSIGYIDALAKIAYALDDEVPIWEPADESHLEMIYDTL